MKYIIIKSRNQEEKNINKLDKYESNNIKSEI